MPTNWKRKTVTRAGDMMRSTSRKKIRPSRAPSTRAASSSVSSTADSAKMRHRYTPNGLTRLGISTAQ